MSDFEAQRLANIAERNALLKQLNLQSKAQAIVGRRAPASRRPPATTEDDGSGKKHGGSAAAAAAAARGNNPAKRVKRERVETFAGPRRTSSRLAGIAAGSDKAAEVDKALVEAAAQREEQERLQRRRRQEDIEFEGSLVLGSDVLLMNGSGKGKYERTFEYDGHDDDDKDDKVNGDIKALRQRMNKLTLWDAFEPARLKVVPERIYAMLVHPTESKPIVFAGDKIGNLGILDASQEAGRREQVNEEEDKPKVKQEKDDADDDDDDDDEEEASPSITTLKPHTRTISAMYTHPSRPERVYTASYDSSIRATDLHKSVAVEVYGPAATPGNDGGGDDDDEPLSGIDMADADANVVYFTTLDGRLGVYDTRTPARDATRHRLSERKIGGFSLHPRAPHYLATASLDRTMKLWDLRRFGTVEDDAADAPLPVGEHLSRLSVSHAAFNAAGQVATSSYDDTVKIHSFGVTTTAAAAMSTWPVGHTLDPASMRPEVVVRHNNQTGRWVTILRPQWQRRPRDGLHRLAIGNMSRFVDIFAADGTQLAQLGGDADGIMAVPAVAVWHETQEWVAGGNASGKVCLWM